MNDQVREELDRVVGKGVSVTWDKRHELPYTMAVIKEIQRFADIAPTGLMHKTVCDVSFHGYSLPQNTLVIGEWFKVVLKCTAVKRQEKI